MVFVLLDNYFFLREFFFIVFFRLVTAKVDFALAFLNIEQVLKFFIFTIYFLLQIFLFTLHLPFFNFGHVISGLGIDTSVTHMADFAQDH